MSKEYPILPIKVEEDDETLCSEDCPYLDKLAFSSYVNFRCLKFGVDRTWTMTTSLNGYERCKECRHYTNNLIILLEKANKE